MSLFTNRIRANSFGAVASAYDAHRPRYSERLVDELIGYGGHRVLDVGAGTGISAVQFADRAADVLAVEPDERMADVARRKGVRVEIATFEQWDPRGRLFDLVVFAASFHWVNPDVALPKVRELLDVRGRLAMMWNRMRPVGDLAPTLVEVIDRYADGHTAESTRSSGDLHELLTAAGFASSERQYSRRFRLSAEDFVALLFTYSRFVVLDEERARALREELVGVLAGGPVEMGGDTVAIIATAAD